MSSLFKYRLLALIVLVGAVISGWLFVNRVEIKQDFFDWWQKRQLPPAVSVAPITIKHPPLAENNLTIKKDIRDIKDISDIKDIEDIKKEETVLPPEINLAVPFIVQAPYANWDHLHDEACEEASLIMLDAWARGQVAISKEEAELAIQNLVKWEKETFGYFEDTTTAESVRVLREYFGLAGAKVVYDVSLEDIRKEVAAGRPIVVPAAGKLLRNPYFRGGGPVYHMLVIKGYTKDSRFITNDPGTRRGADFAYSFSRLYEAIHDWVPGGEMEKGRKAMIVVKP